MLTQRTDFGMNPQVSHLVIKVKAPIVHPGPQFLTVCQIKIHKIEQLPSIHLHCYPQQYKTDTVIFLCMVLFPNAWSIPYDHAGIFHTHHFIIK